MLDVELIVPVVAVTLGWKTVQLARTPRSGALRAIVACQVFAITNNLFAVPEIARVVDAWLAPGTATMLFNGLLVGFFYALLCFYLYATHRESPSRIPERKLRLCIRLNGFLCLGTIVAMMISIAVTPPELRWPRYMDADRHTPSLAAFYLVHSAYLVYALAAAVRLSRSLAATIDTRRSARRTAVGLRCSALGLAVCLVGAAERIPASLAALIGDPVPREIDVIANGGVSLGIVLFAAGVIYPLLTDAVTNARLWLRERYAGISLGPLWKALVAEFPQHKLQVTAWERPRRRVSETLDCLEALSPWMTAPSARDSAVQGASRIRHALHRKAAGLAPLASTWAPRPLTQPVVRSYAEEVTHLVGLSKAFAELPREPRHRVPPGDTPSGRSALG